MYTYTYIHMHISTHKNSATHLCALKNDTGNMPVQYIRTYVYL